MTDKYVFNQDIHEDWTPPAHRCGNCAHHEHEVVEVERIAKDGSELAGPTEGTRSRWRALIRTWIHARKARGKTAVRGLRITSPAATAVATARSSTPVAVTAWPRRLGMHRSTCGTGGRNDYR